jgi:AcrR family transcriptional regulator
MLTLTTFSRADEVATVNIKLYDGRMSTYHHGNLRAALIVTAVDLARARGPEGVVLREVARQTGVSHSAAYRHFAAREELLGTVASVAMTQLEEAMESRMAAVAASSRELRARRRLGEVGRAYLQFALAEPGLFEVAFAAQNARSDLPAGPPTTGPYGVLGRVLDELVDVGAVTAQRRQGADVACWAAVHGFAVLHLHGPLRGTPAEVRETTLGVLLNTIEQGLTAP